MKLSIVRIGNSRGVRLPKAILDQCDVADAVDLSVDGRRIVLTPVHAKPRAGWEEAARRMRAASDDVLSVPDVFPDDEDLKW